MKMSQAFPSKFLKTADLNGHEVTVSISHVKIDDVGQEGQPESKPVLYFIGKEKGMVLNKTNSETLTLTYGDETDDWREKPVIIYPATTTYKGNMVPCLRLRVPTAEAPAGEEPPF